MKNDQKQEHQAAIIDQFSRQAAPFSQQPAHSQDAFLNLLLEMSGVGPADTILDVACGPGLVACAFAAQAKHVTGIDLTPAMIARAHIEGTEKDCAKAQSFLFGAWCPLGLCGNEIQKKVIQEFIKLYTDQYHFDKQFPINGLGVDSMVMVQVQDGKFVLAE